MSDVEFKARFGKTKEQANAEDNKLTHYEKELTNFQFLTTYIDEYQRKLGLYGTKGKQNPIDAMFGTDDHLETVKKSNQVNLDFTTFYESKTHMQSKAIKSNVYENAKSRNFPDSVLKTLSKTEMPKRLQDATLRESRVTRNRILNLFKQEGDTGYEMFNMKDEIRDEVQQDKLERNLHAKSVIGSDA